MWALISLAVRAANFQSVAACQRRLHGGRHPDNGAANTAVAVSDPGSCHCPLRRSSLNENRTSTAEDVHRNSGPSGCVAVALCKHEAIPVRMPDFELTLREVIRVPDRSRLLSMGNELPSQIDEISRVEIEQNNAYGLVDRTFTAAK
jgi:hypothetical protein